MCGFSLGMLFEFAIGVACVVGLIMIVKIVLPGAFSSVTEGPFWGIFRVLIAVAVFVVAVLILWKFLACAGLVSFYR